MVKKFISAAAAAAIVFGSAAALPQGVFDDLGTGITARAATEYTSGFWRFTKNDDNTVYISGYTGFDSSITIPATLEDLKVVGIGDSAFENNQNLEEVIIPANVTYIGYAAFKGSSITKITVPATVKTIALRWGTWGSCQTFMNCTKLKSVVFNAGDINEELFSGCTALTTVKLGSSTKNISSSAFLNCSSLSSINLNNVTSINNEAFAGCKSLGSVTLGNDLAFLGYRAFAQTGLTSVTIPEKAKIGLRWSDWGSASTFSGCEKLTTATINNTYVGEYEFENCPALKTVTLGTNIRTIDSNSFSGNKALTTVINKGNPVYIGGDAFSNCTSLKNINLGSSLVFLGYAAFYGDTSLTTMRIPSTVVSLGLRWGDSGSASTFEGCTNLKDVYIANASMKTDGTYDMFKNVTGFTINTIQDSPAYKYATNNVYSKKTFAAVPSTAVAFNNSNYTLVNGETLILYPEMTPANSTDNYTYISGDTSVAEVNEYGVVTAKKTGLVQIQVTTSSGKKAVCTINVVASGTSSKDAPKKKSIALCTAAVPNVSYTGSALTPEATVLFNPTIELTNGVDYTVTYTNNVNIGTATATFTGIGNYTGKLTKTFTITGDLSKATVSDLSDAVYSGAAQTPAPTVKIGTTVLAANKDYTLSYSNNTNAGTAKITITGKGSYSGTIAKTFNIKPASISAAVISGVSDSTYTGAAVKPVPTVKAGDATLKANTDYTVSYTSNTNAGTATVTVTGKGNYTGTASKQFKITPVSLAKAAVSGLSNKTYTGKALTQTPVVKLGSKTLKSGTDYTVSYKNNKNVGTATVTITGKGNYNGTVKATFKICPKKTAVKKLTSPKTKQLKVTYGKVAGVTGYQITYSTSSKFTKKTTKSVNAAGTSKTIKKLTKGKTYYVKVRTYKTVSGTKYYSGYTAVKKIKVK